MRLYHIFGRHLGFWATVTGRPNNFLRNYLISTLYICRNVKMHRNLCIRGGADRVNPAPALNVSWNLILYMMKKRILNSDHFEISSKKAPKNTKKSPKTVKNDFFQKSKKCVFAPPRRSYIPHFRWIAQKLRPVPTGMTNGPTIMDPYAKFN